MALRRRSPDLLSLEPIVGWNAVNVCHPEWRGVRTAAHATQHPVIESADLVVDADRIVAHCVDQGVPVIVIQGWPNGANLLAEQARSAGLQVLAVSHSSMAQHTAEAGEAAAIGEMTALTKAGVVSRLGFVKSGIAEVFEHAGISAQHVPNRTPIIEENTKIELGEGINIGVFAEPIWRKNLGTQLGATSLLEATAHVLVEPVGTPWKPMVRTHGLLERSAFLDLLSSTDLNMYVSLSECHPLTPIESYLVGVPCLMSRTSDVFASDPRLWELTTVDRLDDPTAVAARAERLIDEKDLATTLAHKWIADNDDRAIAAWQGFIAST